VALALTLRAWGLQWGLPYVEHPDEPSILGTALEMVREGDPNPGRFDKPSLFFYLLAGATHMHAAWGLRAGLYASLQDLPASVGLFTTTPQLFVWNRAVTALLGALTVAALYLLGRAMFDARVGLLAALALAASAFHMQHSAYITTDVPSALGVVVCMLGAWRVVAQGGTGAYVLAGLGAGLAVGTKYNAGVVVLAPLVAHLLRYGRTSLRQGGNGLALSALAAVLTFVLTTPFALLDAPAFLGGLLRLDDNYGGDSTTLAQRLTLLRVRTWDYGSFFWGRALYATGCLLVLAGLPLLLRKAWRQTLLLLTVILAELVALALYKVHFMRNVMAVYPLVVLLPAAAAALLADLLARPVLRRALFGVLGLALLAPQVVETAWLLRYSNRPHTMAVAAERLRALPRGMRAAVETNPVQWSGDPVVFPVEHLGARELEWYRANGFRYLLVNDERRDPKQELPGALEAIRASAEVLEQYPPRRAGVQPGPGGALLDLGEHLEAMRFARREVGFGGKLRLLGYELAPGDLRAQITPLEGRDERAFRVAQPAQINLYWRATAPIERDYTLFVHLVNGSGERVAQRDLPPRHDDYPPSRWQAGELVIDRADLAIPALPPGQYRLLIGLYDAATGERLPLEVPGMQPDEAFELATISILP
jgi:4-amino-4-deoxy-L-arabinose transferase-like glycosyltransferase